MPRRTPSGKKTAVADVEGKLKAEAEKKGLTGRRAAAYEYGTLNRIGLMRGNRTTPKGARAAKSAVARGKRLVAAERARRPRKS